MLDLKAADSPVEESEAALQVLVGLPQGYEVAVGILQFQDDLDLDELLPKLLLAEQRLQEQGDLEAVRVTETHMQPMVLQSTSSAETLVPASTVTSKVILRRTAVSVRVTKRRASSRTLHSDCIVIQIFLGNLNLIVRFRHLDCEV